MAKSMKKAEVLARDLKDRLELRGLSVKEEKAASGWPRLVDASATALWSVEIEGIESQSPDLFGQPVAYGPHKVAFASADAQAKADHAKIMTELARAGVQKVIVKTGADLATAEAAAGEEVPADVRWSLKGM